MKKFITTMFIVFLAITLNAQWSLVWSDEFDNLNTSNWSFWEGPAYNNELQYYRAANASVSNGNLVITARNEAYGGMSYTSARLESYASWTYGRVEARMSLPAKMGTWPAFWMLGTSSETWPGNGEIDIIEQINTDNWVQGNVHWYDASGIYANYAGGTSATVSNYNIYAIEWDASSIKWFVNDVQYHEVNIANSINGTDEFHKPFYIILNLAVGGDMPGFNIDAGSMPWNMYVDYVRVYAASGDTGGDTGGTISCEGSAVTVPATIQAEDYCEMSGIDTETTTDDGGGINVGWIDAGDWMKYAVNVPSAGTYTVSYRVASPSGSQLTLDYNSGTALGTITVPATGDWQAWTTISHDVTLSAGVQNLSIYAEQSGFNVNWFQISNVGSGSGDDGGTVTTSIQVEAENYSEMSGIDTESCTEGGSNVGWIDAGDWMAYSNINIPTAGTYTIDYRVASESGGGSLQFELQGGGAVYGSLSVPSTGGWQNWTTISHSVSLNAGTQNFAIYAPAGGWNLNWFSINGTTTKSGEAFADLVQEEENINIYPLPAHDFLNIQNTNFNNLQLIDLSGKVLFSKELMNQELVSLNARIYNPGMYFIILQGESEVISKKVVLK